MVTISDITGIQWEISKYGVTKPALSFLYNSSESNIQINIYLHSVAIIEFPKWQLLFHLQKIKYNYNWYNLKTKNANYLKF